MGALRRAATTHQNHPEAAKIAISFVVEATEEVEGKAKLPSGPSNATDSTGSRAMAASEKRFDFGIGVSRCGVCDSRIPRLNRGCETCNVRMCRRCFGEHNCRLESAHEADTELLRSTPGIFV